MEHSELRLLKGIKSPADLASLDNAQLNELAEEIRGYLITTVSRNG